MRKYMALPIAGMLALTIAAPALAGASVTNTSGGGETIYGVWSSEGTMGYVFLGEETGHGGFGEIYLESGEWVACEPSVENAAGNTKSSPQDTGPADEFRGFVGTRTYGRAFDLTISLSRRLETGSATGLVELVTETVNECEGIFGEPTSQIAPLDVDLIGVGSLASFRGSGHYKMPSEFNGHENYRGTERAATGSVVVGDAIDTTLDFGSMSRVTWTQHTNGG
ncbi:MAG: hypothetical protein H0U52_15140 [Chloroflexi bacterium]|nr:hypothetical protein [Chloroflexota bacterium]